MKIINDLLIGPDCFEIFITSDDFPELPINHIELAGIAQLKPPYHVSRVDVPAHTMLFTSSGQGKLTTADGVQIIGPQTMTVIPAGSTMRFEIDAEHWNMCWILFPDTQYWQSLMPSTPEVRSTGQAMNVFHLSHVIDQERHLGPTFRENSIRQLAQYMEYNLKANIPVNEDRLNAAFAIVEQSLHKAWTVEDIAALTFYSEPHLFRLCKQRYGKGPKQVIRDIRIERAKQLLKYTDWSLGELAGRLGFSDQFNFSNRFKKDVGLSPTHFREKISHENES